MKNLHLFDTSGSIKKYKNAEQILEEFVKIRLEFNQKRKDYLIKTYTETLIVVENKIRFLEEIINGTIVIYKKTKKEIENVLSIREYTKIDENFQYLISMPIYSFQKEKIDELKSKRNEFTEKLKNIKIKTVKNILLDDLEKIN